MTQAMKGIIRIVKKNHRSFENMGLIKSIENEANCFALSKTCCFLYYKIDGRNTMEKTLIMVPYCCLRFTILSIDGSNLIPPRQFCLMQNRYQKIPPNTGHDHELNFVYIYITVKITGSTKNLNSDSKYSNFCGGYRYIKLDVNSVVPFCAQNYVYV